jgi:hypothetical protein
VSHEAYVIPYFQQKKNTLILSIALHDEQNGFI